MDISQLSGGVLSCLAMTVQFSIECLSWGSSENENVGNIAAVLVIIMMRGVGLTDVLHGSGNYRGGQGCTMPTLMDC